jgi:predicted ArsR family transcriptional regulator
MGYKQIEIAEKLGVNKRTILRDFKELKNRNLL